MLGRRKEGERELLGLYGEGWRRLEARHSEISIEAGGIVWGPVLVGSLRCINSKAGNQDLGQ